MKCIAVLISCALFLGCGTLGLASAQTAPVETPPKNLTPAEIDLKLVGILDSTIAVVERSEAKRTEFKEFVVAKQLLPDPILINLGMVFGGMSNSWRIKFEDAKWRFHQSKKGPAEVFRYQVEVGLFLPSYAVASEDEIRAWMNAIRAHKDKISAEDLKRVSDLADAAWNEHDPVISPMKNGSFWMLSKEFDQQLDRLFTAAFTPPYDRK